MHTSGSANDDKHPCLGLGLAVLLAVLPVLAGTIHAAPLVAGWIERVRIVDVDFEVRAKLDTGAKHSSLNATGLVEFERDGEAWVRFRVVNWKNEEVEIERPLLRTAKIKRHFVDSQNRPVIELTLCVGSLARKVEVNLVDRGRFNYPLLVGRSFLAGGIQVDAARRYAQPPSCGVGAHE
jgi:hypothetical protein